MKCLKGIQKNYVILMKLIHLILSCISLVLIIHYEAYELPRWIWIIYTIDSLTYIIIILVILLCYVFKSNYQSYDFYFTVFGIPTNVAGTFGGFIQELCIEPPDADNGPNQIYLSSLLLIISILMITQVALTMYITRKKCQQNVENISGTQQHS